jgi:hypothetical protein
MVEQRVQWVAVGRHVERVARLVITHPHEDGLLKQLDKPSVLVVGGVQVAGHD